MFRQRRWLAIAGGFAVGLLAMNKVAAAGAMRAFEPSADAALLFSPGADLGASSSIGMRAEAGLSIADFSGGVLISGAGDDSAPMTESSAAFLSPELVGCVVDYAGIKLTRSLRADHVLLKHPGDSADRGGDSALLNAAILVLSIEIVSRQSPR
jgi:hypothetical protein